MLKPRPGWRGPADEKPDRQGERRHRLEIEQRLDADPPDFLEILHRRDAVHDRAEDHRRNHHLDKRDEAVAERLQGDAGLRKIVSDEDADRDRDQDLNVEDRVPGTPPGRDAGRHGGGKLGHGRILLRRRRLSSPCGRLPRPEEIPQFPIGFLGRLLAQIMAAGQRLAAPDVGGIDAARSSWSRDCARRRQSCPTAASPGR